MELQRKRAMEYITSTASVLQPQATQFVGITNETQINMLRKMETCAIRLKRAMQKGIANAKAEKNADVATAIARMAREIYGDIDTDTRGEIHHTSPPRPDNIQVNDSSEPDQALVEFVNQKVMRVFLICYQAESQQK